MSDPISSIPSPTETDDYAPLGLCLLLGASFFGQCRHIRCRAINAAVAAADNVLAMTGGCDDPNCGCRR